LRVLKLARDRIHAGWHLLTHPLYGNIQPFQQPYRSLLIGRPDPEERSGPDPEMLCVLEKAILLFSPPEEGGRPPARHSSAILEDYAELDACLLRESLEKYGIWKPASR